MLPIKGLLKGPRLSRYLLFALLSLLLCSIGVQAKPSLKIDATPREVILGHNVEVTLSLVQDANGQGAMQQVPSLALPDLPDFQVLSQQSASTFANHNQQMRMMVQSQYVLQPLKSGDLTIPSLRFEYTENGQKQTVQTEAITIHVKGSAFSYNSLIYMLLTVFLLLIVALIAFVLWRRLSKKTPVPESATRFEARPPSPPPINPQTVLSYLDLLDQDLEQGQDPREILEALYGWFRELASERGWLQKTGASHQELIHYLKYESGLKASIVAEIESFVNACDQMRFANQPIHVESLQHLIDVARRFDK